MGTGTGWMLWFKGPRAVQRELDRSDTELADARDALVEARRAVIAVRSLFGETDGDVVDLEAVRRSRPKVPVVAAMAGGAVALIAAAAMVTDARMIPFLTDPDAELQRSAEQAQVEMEPASSVSTDPNAATPAPEEVAGAVTAAAAAQAAQTAPSAPGGGGVSTAPINVEVDLPDVQLPPLPQLPVPPLPPLPERPDLPDVTVPTVPALPPPPTLPVQVPQPPNVTVPTLPSLPGLPLP